MEQTEIFKQLKNVEELEKEEELFNNYLETIKNNPFLMLRSIPKMEYLLSERERLVGLTFKQKIKKMKFKGLKFALKRQIKKASK